MDALPPFLVFYLARRGWGLGLKRPPLPDLAKAAGMSERTFVRIGRRMSWADVKVRDADSFMKACNVDFFWPHKQTKYMLSMAPRGSFKHLSKQQQARFEVLLAEWEVEKQAKTCSNTS